MSTMIDFNWKISISQAAFVLFVTIAKQKKITGWKIFSFQKITMKLDL